MEGGGWRVEGGGDEVPKHGVSVEDTQTRRRQSQKTVSLVRRRGMII